MFSLKTGSNPFNLWLPPGHAETMRKDNWEEGHTRASEQKLHSSHHTIRVSFAERLKHLTWAWFTLVMSSGGLALLLHSTPHRFRGLDVIGKIFFIITIVFYLLLVLGIANRFVRTPAALRTSLMHPTESLFFPCSLLSVATILLNASAYGISETGPWLPDALRVCFWIYAAFSIVSAIVQFFVLFSGAHLPIHSMTPGWILPIFPSMLIGTLASSIAPHQSPEHRLPILVAGVTFQGLGWIVASLVYPLYLGRLMQDGLPAPAMRPGMFIAVGPAGYTTVALIGMSRAIPDDYGYFAANPMAAQVLRIMALWVGIWIWAVGFWFFSFSLLAVVGPAIRWRLRFSMTWWSFVFPNVGFTIATAMIGEELESEGIKWVTSALTICLVAVWFLVIYAQISAVVRRKVLWPGRDEDK